jgi:hypothetical protein
MALVGGGGAGNVAGSNPSGIGTSINYVRTVDGTFAYAYSGVVTANGSDTTAMEFTTGNETIVGVCYPTLNTDAIGANFLSFQIKFNSEIIVIYKERRDLGSQIETPFDIIIPPYTHVEVVFPNNAQDADLTAVITGRVY